MSANRWSVVLIVAAIAALSGCQTPGQSAGAPSTTAPVSTLAANTGNATVSGHKIAPDHKAVLDLYADCVFGNAREFALQPGEPMSLAIAARSSCRREERALEGYYASQLGQGDPLTQRVTEGARQRVLENSIALIVRKRSNALKAATQQQDGSADTPASPRQRFY